MNLTSFVGREADVAALQRSMAASRLVTVLGPAGVGKTRLVAEALGRRPPGGAPRRARRGDLHRGRARGGGGGGGRPRGRRRARPALAPEARTARRIGERPVVVVLDNCEHVADAAAGSASALLSTCPNLTIVATSREPLDLDGEAQLTLQPLAPADAAALFADRARTVQPRFGSADELAGLEDLCRRLDGLPLAIELAAARAKVLPLAQMAEMLDDRFTLLRAHRRHGDGRHAGLRAAIDSSYELLFDDERRLFRALAPFAGGVTLETATAVFGPDALDLVTRLVDRSLLFADISGPRPRSGCWSRCGPTPWTGWPRRASWRRRRPGTWPGASSWPRPRRPAHGGPTS